MPHDTLLTLGPELHAFLWQQARAHLWFHYGPQTWADHQIQGQTQEISNGDPCNTSQAQPPQMSEKLRVLWVMVGWLRLLHWSAKHLARLDTSQGYWIISGTSFADFLILPWNVMFALCKTANCTLSQKRVPHNSWFVTLTCVVGSHTTTQVHLVYRKYSKYRSIIRNRMIDVPLHLTKVLPVMSLQLSYHRAAFWSSAPTTKSSLALSFSAPLSVAECSTSLWLTTHAHTLEFIQALQNLPTVWGPLDLRIFTVCFYYTELLNVKYTRTKMKTVTVQSSFHQGAVWDKCHINILIIKNWSVQNFCEAPSACS